MRKTVRLALGFSVALSSGALAATLDVKPGLWEIATQGEAGGVPPIPPQALARLSPEQRAQMMAAMQGAMTRMNQPSVSRSCVTQKMLDRGMDLDPKNGRCTHTVVASTPHSLEVRMVCTGEQKMNGTMHVDATSRETFTGALDMVSTDGTNTMTMKRTLQGRWLGSDCGDVKPHE
jgi:hypothetical protein